MKTLSIHQAQLRIKLEGINNILSHLHTEMIALEQKSEEMLKVLRKFQQKPGPLDQDELTGLWRRGKFLEIWNELLHRARRSGKDVGLVMIDLDHFNKINQVHGSRTGDEVLKRVGTLLSHYNNQKSFVGRYSGEEFVLAVVGTEAEILGMAEFIRRGVEKLHGSVVDSNGQFCPKVHWKCTLSLGVASAKKNGFDSEATIRAAQKALTLAKKRGRNRIQAA